MPLQAPRNSVEQQSSVDLPRDTTRTRSNADGVRRALDEHSALVRRDTATTVLSELAELTRDEPHEPSEQK